MAAKTKPETVKAIVARCAENPFAAAVELEAETARDRPRSSLVRKLEAIIAAGPPDPEPDEELDRSVLDLRRGGIPLAKVAEQLRLLGGVDEAAQRYAWAFAETRQQLPEDVRRLALDRLERLMTPLWAKAMRGDLAAISQLERLEMDRVQLAGRGATLPADLDAGPAERATRAEVSKLHMDEHTLGVQALAVARALDLARDNQIVAMQCSRELRQVMTNLRNLAGWGRKDEGEKAAGGDVVVPESRLAAVRKRAEQRVRR